MNLSAVIADTLHKKYLNSQMAGVYLAKYSNEEDMLSWADTFIAKITSTSKHPDILWVIRDDKDKDTKEKDYKVDSKAIANFITFLNYRPYELKTKLVFLRDAHLLSTIVSNKLLKTLEELPNYACVFLLAPQDESLLQTVESRAIRINIPSQANPTELSWHDCSGPREVIEVIKKSDNEHLIEKNFIESMIDTTLNKPTYTEVSNLLSDLELYKKSSEFNNALVSRITILKK